MIPGRSRPLREPYAIAQSEGLRVFSSPPGLQEATNRPTLCKNTLNPCHARVRPLVCELLGDAEGEFEGVWGYKGAALPFGVFF